MKLPKLPPVVLAALALLVAVVVVTLLVAVLAGYRTGEIVAFVGEIVAVAVASIALIRRAVAPKDDAG